MATAQLRYSAADRRHQILDAAMELFARQGYQGTTTRQIAERARVNEAIIFRHFPSKEDLYWAVIERKCQSSKGPVRLKDRLGEDEQQVFAGLAQEMLDRRSKDNTLSRLLLFSALENHRLSHRFFRTYIAAYYETLADYIRQRIEQGRFRNVDPLLAARGFLGMVVYHSWIQELYGGKRYQKFDNRYVSQVLTEIWLAGMRTRESGVSRQAENENSPAFSRPNGGAARKRQGNESEG